MTIPAGTRLGRYEVTSPLGAGGMGEVYRARDLELDRTVAVKVLPSRVASNPELRTRFEREARVVSALNHPNICTLHDVGREGDVAFFVMELLDGESLDDRLKKGALPIETALAIAAQIASALAAAHRRGIIHRDLKPANVMITKSGVKLLDFGIARLGISDQSSSEAPTVAGAITTEGTILGTLQYMSPEQLEGKPTDARADLFSFGCMLYEMIAGRRAFDGKSQASVITAIMSTEPPPLPAIVSSTSPAVDRLVRKCLAKSPDDRWQNAADLETELRWIADDRGVTPAATRAKRSGWLWPAIAIAAIAALIATMLFSRRGAAPAEVLRATIANPGVVATNLLTHDIALSPDGRHVAFVVYRDGRYTLWIRTLSEDEAKPVPTVSSPAALAWSPDAKSLAFAADGKLQRIERGSSEPETICAVSPGAIVHLAWGGDGSIVFAELGGKPSLFRVPATGGQPVSIAGTDPGGVLRAAWPAFAGDSKHLLYEVVGPAATSRLFTVTLDSNEKPRDLGPISSRVQIIGDTMLYVRDSTLFAQRIDSKSMQRIGDAVRIAQHVIFYGSLGGAGFSASQRSIVHQTSFVDARLSWFDRSGNVTDINSTERPRNTPRLSRDGMKGVFNTSDAQIGTADIAMVDLVRGAVVRVTATPQSEGLTLWSPDGTKIAYQTDRDGPPHILMQSIGSATTETITEVGGVQYPSDWTADGKTIVFDDSNAAFRRDIMLVDARPHATPRVWLQTPFVEQRGRVSWDGKWMAFISNASGRNELYVAPFDKPSDAVQVSTGGAAFCAWRRDGAEIFYTNGDGRMFSVAIRTTPHFDAAPPQLLFRNVEGTWDGFDVTADGSRFLVTRTLQSARTLPMELVVNWRELMNQPPR